jgi:hypothetical protein
MRNVTLAWSYIEIEHERGWGSKPDGFVAFASKELALKANQARIAPRLKETFVPDYYVNWEDLRERPVTPEVAERIRNSNGRPVYYG